MRIIKITKNLQEDEKSWPQILAILSSSLAVVSSGFLFAWGSPFITTIIEDKETYNITENEASYFTVLNFITMMLAPLVIPIINIIGRKTSLLLTALPFIISILIKAFARKLWLFYVSRLIYGLGDAILYSCLPVYIGEISTPEVRGSWGNAFACGAVIGHFSVNLIGTYFSIQNTSFIGLIFPLLFLATFSVMPESPYYYVLKGKEEDAKESLRKLRHKFNVDKEFEDIKAGIRRQMSEAGTWKDLFLIKSNRRALIAGVFVRFGQQLSGFFVFSTYIQYIFHKAVSNIGSHISAIIYTSLVAILYTIASSFTDKLGRRLAFMVSLSAAALINFAEGIYFYIDVKHPKLNLESLRWFPLFGLIMFAIISSFGVGIIPSLMASELFSASIKSKAAGLVTISYAGGIFIVNNIFYYLNSYFGLHAPFFFFGSCNIICTFLTYFLVPETKGKTLEEIQLMLKSM